MRRHHLSKELENFSGSKYLILFEPVCMQDSHRENAWINAIQSILQVDSSTARDILTYCLNSIQELGDNAFSEAASVLGESDEAAMLLEEMISVAAKDKEKKEVSNAFKKKKKTKYVSFSLDQLVQRGSLNASSSSESELRSIIREEEQKKLPPQLRLSSQTSSDALSFRERELHNIRSPVSGSDSSKTLARSSSDLTRFDGLKEGRRPCGCCAQRHPLVGNCVACGRIVCRQEGVGDCFFCGAMVGVPGKKVHARKRIHNTIVNNESTPSTRRNGSNKNKPVVDDDEEEEEEEEECLRNAISHKNMLLKFDSNIERKSVVLDDNDDWFSSSISVWATPEEREVARRQMKQQKLKEMEARSGLGGLGGGLGGGARIGFDILGRQVLEKDEDVDSKKRKKSKANQIQLNGQELVNAKVSSAKLQAIDDFVGAAAMGGGGGKREKVEIHSIEIPEEMRKRISSDWIHEFEGSNVYSS